MNFIKTPIEGVIIVEPRVFNDPRGYFFESYNEKTTKRTSFSYIATFLHCNGFDTG